MDLNKLKQEAEEYISSNCKRWEFDGLTVDDIVSEVYLAGAEPREKRIAELEHQLTHRNCVDCSNHSSNLRMRNLALEKENAELRKIAEFQQSSNMSRHFENKKLKESLAVGSTFNKALNSMNKNLEEERDKYRNMVFDKDEQLTKAKELLKQFMKFYERTARECYSKDFQKTLADTEQFLSEVENV